MGLSPFRLPRLLREWSSRVFHVRHAKGDNLPHGQHDTRTAPGGQDLSPELLGIRNLGDTIPPLTSQCLRYYRPFAASDENLSVRTLLHSLRPLSYALVELSQCDLWLNRLFRTETDTGEAIEPAGSKLWIRVQGDGERRAFVHAPLALIALRFIH